QAKGVVRREVIQVITPGTVMESSMLDETESNYIASLSAFEQGSFVLVYHDVSTGETNLILIESSFSQLMHELGKQSVKELVIASDLADTYTNELQSKLQLTFSYVDDVSLLVELIELYDNIDDDRH